jgi:hypothetical protein
VGQIFFTHFFTSKSNLRASFEWRKIDRRPELRYLRVWENYESMFEYDATAEEIGAYAVTVQAAAVPPLPPVATGTGNVENTAVKAAVVLSRLSWWF